MSVPNIAVTPSALPALVVAFVNWFISGLPGAKLHPKTLTAPLCLFTATQPFGCHELCSSSSSSSITHSSPTSFPSQLPCHQTPTSHVPKACFSKLQRINLTKEPVCSSLQHLLDFANPWQRGLSHQGQSLFSPSGGSSLGTAHSHFTKAFQFLTCVYPSHSVSLNKSGILHSVKITVYSSKT